MSKIRTGKDIQCITCRKSFYAAAWQLRSGKKFCSVDCKSRYMKTVRGDKSPRWKGGKTSCICKYCKNSFEEYPSRLRSGKGKFCSCSCKNKYQTTLTGEKSSKWQGGPKFKRKCETCGKEFGLYSEKTNAKGRFCSKGCMVVWQRTLIQEKANQWKGGLVKPRRNYPGRFSQHLRNRIKERDKWVCQGCGLTDNEHKKMYKEKGLHVHHIDSNVDNIEETNLVTVCTQCNNRARFNKDYWEKFYKDKLVLQ